MSIDLEEVPPHEPELWPDWLAEIKITDVIVKSMGRIAKYLLTHNSINVIDGISERRPIDGFNKFLEKKENKYPNFYNECKAVD